jgi:hypothetical protein
MNEKDKNWDYDPEKEGSYYASDRHLKEDGPKSYDKELDD